MPDPSQDDGLHLVRRDEPKSHRLTSEPAKAEAALIQSKRERPDIPNFFTVGRVSLAVAAAVCIVFLIWSGDLIRRAHRAIGVPERAVPSPASVEVAGPAAISADMLHVTSISLGKDRLAVVNDQRLAEGDSLQLKISTGPAWLRVASIEDGVVRFRYGRQMIDTRLSASHTDTKSP